MASRDYRIRWTNEGRVLAQCQDPEARCDHYAGGWWTVCDESTEEGAMVAMLIRSRQMVRSGQVLGGDWTETRDERGRAVFHFPSGQRCFREHWVRPAVLTVRQGGESVRHTRLADWGEDLAEHWDTVKTIEKEG